MVKFLPLLEWSYIISRDNGCRVREWDLCFGSGDSPIHRTDSHLCPVLVSTLVCFSKWSKSVWDERKASLLMCTGPVRSLIILGRPGNGLWPLGYGTSTWLSNVSVNLRVEVSVHGCTSENTYLLNQESPPLLRNQNKREFGPQLTLRSKPLIMCLRLNMLVTSVHPPPLLPFFFIFML